MNENLPQNRVKYTIPISSVPEYPSWLLLLSPDFNTSSNHCTDPLVKGLYFQTSSTPLMPSRDYEKSWSNNWIENCSACSVSQSIPMLINNAVGQFVSKSTPWTLIKAAISSISRYFPSSTILSLPQWVSVRGQTLKQTTQDLQN